MIKTGRNDPCPCGSGKKFKKCCESKTIRGPFQARLADADSAPQIQKTLGMTSLFQAHLAATPIKPMPPEVPPQDPISEGAAADTTPSGSENSVEEKAEFLIT